MADELELDTAESAPHYQLGSGIPFATMNGETIRAGHHPGADQGDPAEKVFSIYVARAEEYDRALVECWKDDMDGILIFAGLFSASVTAFIIESYKNLKPDSSDQMLVILSIMSQQLGAMSNSSLSATPSPSLDRLPFQTSPSALRVNAYWFLSLTFSLICALTATLVKQWSRNYLQEINRHPVAYKRARVRTYLFQGLLMFKMPAVVDAVPALLHISLFLFFVGLVEFLQPINHLLAFVVLGVLATGSLLYMVTIILPSFFPQCPYQTPLSHMWWQVWCYIIRSIIWTYSSFQGLLFRAGIRIIETWKWRLRIDVITGTTLVQRKARIAMLASPEHAKRDDWALKWTLEQLNEAHELEPFLLGLSSFVKSRAVDGHERLRKLLDAGLARRIYQQLWSSWNNHTFDASEQKICMACLEVVWLSARHFCHGIEDKKELIRSLTNLTTTATPSFASRARFTLAIVTYYSLCEGIGPQSFDLDRSRAALNALKYLPIMQPLHLLFGEYPSEHVWSHTPNVCLLSLVQAGRECLQNPSEPLRLQAFVAALTHWTTIEGVMCYTRQDSLKATVIELKCSLELDLPQTVHNIVDQIYRMIHHPTWSVMAYNIQEGRDPNDGIIPLPIPVAPLSPEDLDNVSETSSEKTLASTPMAV